MTTLISKYIDKLFFKKWIIGVCDNTSIEDIIRAKKFDPEIKWIKTKSTEKFDADPFPFRDEDGTIKILYETFVFDENYGKISLLELNTSLKQSSDKVILNTQSHLSYPLIYKEADKFYVFPEASKSGKLSCYEYNPVSQSLNFLQDIIHRPLLDATILKHEGLYWIFGSERKTIKSDYQLYIFYSKNLLGPYTEHATNPVRSGLDGIRSAGNFVEVDGFYYRPSQNCKNQYGESVVINKVTELTVNTFVEERYMDVHVNTKRKFNSGMHTLHTINATDDFIVLDGEYWFLSPFNQLKKYLKKIIEPRNSALKKLLT